jgi:putative transposase
VKKERTELVEKSHPTLSVRTQCKLLAVPRSSLDYQPAPEREGDGRLMRLMDEIYLIDPCIGTRRLVRVLERDHGQRVNRKRLRRLRRKMGLETIWCRPQSTSALNASHRKYPYLLRHLKVMRSDQVWCADITYVPMARGHAYLCAVMDWHSRKVLGWRVSNTMDAALCRDALAMAVGQSAGRLPEIFNTDQGSQFTSQEWTGQLEGLGIAISMDGKGRWMDNVFIERLWRSVKHEEIYLREYATVTELEAGLEHWFKRYNTWRPHQHLDNRTPEQAHCEGRKSPVGDEPREQTKQAA